MSTALPAGDDRDWVIEELASLIRSRGAEHFLNGRILQATPADFPDPWSPDESGVETMILRLLSYIGLERLEVSLELFDEDVQHEHLDAPMVGNSWHRDGAAAWYAGREGDTVFFGVESSQLDDPERLVGTLAHEVAHVFRDVHGLMVQDRDEEEFLTDLTTIFLGFGVLTVNGAYRYRSSGDWNYTQWSVEQGGYLSPETLSFALAVQAVVRELPPRKLASLLETNQAASFRASCGVLEKDRAGLRERLGVPAGVLVTNARRASPPPRIVRARAALRVVGAAEVEPEEAHSDPVFRVKRSWALPFGYISFFSLAVALPLTAVKFGSHWVPWVLIGLPVTGLLLGRAIARDHCSDPDCAGPIAAMDRTCRTCGGEIRGTIRRARDRLAAAEALDQSES